MKGGDFRIFVRTEGRGVPIPDDQAIRDHFRAFGEITDCHHPARSPDICYVTFSSQWEVNLAVQQPSVSIAGVPCTVQPAAPRGEYGGSTPAIDPSQRISPALAQAGAAAAAGKGGKGPPPLTADRRRIYVTGLPMGVPDIDQQLHAYFSYFGEVADIYVPADHTTGTKKPFGFVTMTTNEEADSILAQAPHVISDGVEIGVTVAEPKEGKGGGKFPSRMPAHPQSAALHPSQSLAHPVNGGKGAAPPAASGAAAAKGQAGAVQGVSSPFRLFVAGLPQGLNSDMLRGHFARHGEILDIYLPPRNPEIAYITFSTREEVQDAIANSGLRIAGYWVKAVEAAEERPGMKGKGSRYSFGPY